MVVAGVGVGRDFWYKQPSKMGGVSCEQKRLRQGPAFIVHEQGLHIGRPPRGPVQQRWTHFTLHTEESHSFGHQKTGEMRIFLFNWQRNVGNLTEDWKYKIRNFHFQFWYWNVERWNRKYSMFRSFFFSKKIQITYSGQSPTSWHCYFI